MYVCMYACTHDCAQQFHAQWVEDSWRWLVSVGLPPSLLARQVHPPADLAHYAKACTDILFRYPFGEQVSQ
jgi:glycyl-tRNA synthetase